MLYDSHTHLNSPELFEKYEEYLKNFFEHNGKILINVGVDEERTLRGIEIHKKYPNNCFTSVGFHPSASVFCKEFREDSEKYLKKVEKFIKKCVEDKNVIAIGECGFDYHYDVGELEKKLQEKLFILQCELARKYDLPIIIHTRDAFHYTIEILEKYKDLKINFHCWGYGPEEIKIVQEKFDNIRIGFDGNITYKKAQDLRDSVLVTDFDKILIETDAPYLTPQIVRKEMNQPANIRYTYDFISELRKIKLSDLKKQIENNFTKLFGKLG